jgi:ComF family protein
VPHFDASFAPLRYRYPVKALIARYKFQADLALGEQLAQIFADAWRLSGRITPDLVVPVPLHHTRLRERGFNQALELARTIAPAIGARSHEALLRVRATETQQGLKRPARRANVRAAFQIAGFDVRGRSVLLIDDVMTTGATLDSCARVLKRAGAAHVTAAAIARAGRGRRQPG